ncbi:tachykinin-like peptides receptor 86C [Hydra vulgaris]|uniref:Tachykinin-like peptides receptor 86C n=1 Tax=Hydra vulgaris TaxID=6087 RepID=A0ABM4B5Z1_HYDVU
MNCNSTLSNLDSKLLKICFGVSFVTLAIAGSITNAIVLVTQRKFKVLHTVTNQILAHLAITDFLLAVLIPPLFLLQLFFESLETNCKVETLRRFLTSFLIGVSGGIIAIISYDRYLHLKRLCNYKLTKKKLRYLSSFCLVLSFTISSLRFAKESQKVYSTAVLLFLLFVFISIIFCYSLIGWALYQHSKITKLNLNYENKTVHRRACKTAILIVTSFSVTVIPLAWFQIQTLSEHKKNKDLALGYTLGILMVLFNTVINPIIYYYRTPKLRQCLKQTLHLKDRKPKQKMSNTSFQYNTTQV